MSLEFSFTPTSEGGEIRLSAQKLFARRVIPPVQWPDADGQPLAPALRLLGKLTSSGRATIAGDAVHVSTSELVEVPGSVLTMLGVPQIAPLSLALALHGRVEAPDGEIEMRWTDDNSRQIAIARTGIVVRYAGQAGRLTATLAAMLSAVENYNESRGLESAVRLRCWQAVQSELERLTGRGIEVDRLLKNFRIYQAGAFALDVRETPAGAELDPIPMARGMRQSLADETAAPENGNDVDEEVRDNIAHALLPPALQRQFEDAFNQDGLATRPAYILGRSTYLVIDPETQAALDVVKQAQRAPAAERRAFIRNPREALVAAMPEAGEAIGTLFVETRQYSERVVGLGLWTKPVLDWIRKQGSGWLPETFSFNIGDTSLQMTAESFEQLGARVDQAVAGAETSFPFEGHVLSVAEAAAAFDDVRARGTVDGQPCSPTDEKTAERDSNILLIEENIESSEFHRSIRPRPLFAQKLFPSDKFVTEPKPHQYDGFGWLVDAWVAGLPGALLADDMGLGKTMQALAFLVWLRENLNLAGDRANQLGGPILIVAPTALLRNWQKEVSSHLRPGALGPCVEVFGKGLSRLKRPDQNPEDAIDVNALRDAAWILTTYETLANYHRAFARVGFSVAIFDEMQKIKAPDTINTHAAKTINADFVLGMTGTPIENRIEDLWCIMDRVAPGFLGALKPFSQQYGGGDAVALEELKARLDAGAKGFPPIMLRRMKHDHLRGLPERSFKVYGTPSMPAVQAAAYQAIVQSATTGAAGRKLDMLRTVHALRGISLHPSGATGIDPYDAKLATDWVEQSARLKQVMAVLFDIRAKGEKALVFIEDRAIQAAFAAVAAAQLSLRREPEIINGETAADERQAIVDRFQARPRGFDLLVLSPKAAGIGLTITAANHVIHLSRWWNPAVEDQCNDRVFRIGQDKPVTVHIPMSVHPVYDQDSFDIKLNAMLERKRSLSRDMLAPPVSDSDASELFGQTVGASAGQ